MEDNLLTAQDEFDVSDAGVPTLHGAVATITNFAEVEKQNGTLHEITFEVAGLGFPITKGYWVKHSNPKAVQAGRGQLKRIANAALGQPRYTRTNLIGRQVLVDVGEDAQGFAQISRITAVSGATPASQLVEASLN